MEFVVHEVSLGRDFLAALLTPVSDLITINHTDRLQKTNVLTSKSILMGANRTTGLIVDTDEDN